MGAHCLLLLLFFFLSTPISLSGHAAAAPPLGGGFRPITNVDDPHVQALGRFAVSEHNPQAGKSLVFVRVISGEEQALYGVVYKLVIEATDNEVANLYEAMVHEDESNNYRPELTFFQYKGRVPMLAAIGRHQPIVNISDPHVQAVGRFAISVHNKKSKNRLEFLRVLSGQEQVHRVGTQSYTLVIAAKHGKATHHYRAVVFFEEHGWKLTHFKGIP